VIYGRFGYGIAAPTVSMEAEHAGFAFRDDPGPTGRPRLVSKDEARRLFPPIFERAASSATACSPARRHAGTREYRIPSTGGTGRAPYYVLIELEGQGEALPCTASRRSGNAAWLRASSCSSTRSRRRPRPRGSSGAISSASTSLRE
jgi:hypothetical protein